MGKSAGMFAELSVRKTCGRPLDTVDGPASSQLRSPMLSSWKSMKLSKSSGDIAASCESSSPIPVIGASIVGSSETSV